MNDFDKIIKQKIEEEDISVPDVVKERIDKALSDLPEKESKPTRIKLLPKIAAAAACFIFICFVVLPNCSTTYAHALEKVPVIGSFVRVVTIRNYFYSDGNHDMDIEVPSIESEKGDAVDFINKDVDELTKILADRFNKEVEEVGDKGHSGIFVDYDVITNTDRWFTLRIRVHEAAGSSNTYYKFYHIDKTTGKIVTLKDLFTTEDFSSVLETEIKRQMKEMMAADHDKLYWVDRAEIGYDFVNLDNSHNFYWNENGDLVIAFDKYEVAPGYMGTPEFAIKKDVIKDILKEEYR